MNGPRQILYPPVMRVVIQQKQRSNNNIHRSHNGSDLLWCMTYVLLCKKPVNEDDDVDRVGEHKQPQKYDASEKKFLVRSGIFRAVRMGFNQDGFLTLVRWKNAGRLAKHLEAGSSIAIANNKCAHETH